MKDSLSAAVSSGGSLKIVFVCDSALEAGYIVLEILIRAGELLDDAGRVDDEPAESSEDTDDPFP